MRNLSLSAISVTSFQDLYHVTATAVDVDAGVIYVASERQDLDADVQVEISKINPELVPDVSCSYYIWWVWVLNLLRYSAFSDSEIRNYGITCPSMCIPISLVSSPPGDPSRHVNHAWW
jgi:hypothetical protein